MKKTYIAPNAKGILINTEDILLNGSPGIGDGEGSAVESNHRTTSQSIWGDED